MKQKVKNQETKPLLSQKNNDDIVVFDQQISLNDQKYFQLPQQVPCDFKGIQEKIDLKSLKNQPQELADLGTQLAKHFEKILKVWDVDGNHKFHFNLPPSYFLQEIQIESQNSQNMNEEQNVVRKLSPKQIEQIYQTGTFEIPSKNFPIPYIWQLSAWVIKGKLKIAQSFIHDLSLAYRNFKFIPLRLKNDQDHKGPRFPFTVRAGFYNIIYKLYLYPSLFVGYEHTRRIFDKNAVKNVLEAERQTYIKKSVKFSVALYEYMFYKDSKDSVDQKKANQRVQKLIDFASKFDKEAERLKQQMQNYYDLQVEQKGTLLEVDIDEKKEYQQNILNQINEQVEDYMKKYNIEIDINMDINQQIEQAKYNAQMQMWNEDKQFDKELKQSIFNLSECRRIYEYHYKLYRARTQQLSDEYLKKVKSQNPIRGQYKPFVDQTVRAYRTPIRKSLKKDMYEQIIKELNQNKIPETDIIKNFVEFKQSFKDKFKQLHDSFGKQQREPIHFFRLTRNLFPKYEVEQVDKYYRLKRTQVYKLDTKQSFWRIRLVFYRWYIWTNNEMYFLFANAFVGPLGIKALFSINDFHPDVECDRNTGVIRPTNYKVTPVIGRFIRVYDGMIKSRQHFENAPDTGFFGKNLARIWNLFEVYVFRFLFAGIICVLILQPILIIANSALSLLLAVTAWIWTPILLILRLLFQLFVYDFDFLVYRRKLRETQNWFPIITLSYRLLVYGFLQLILSLLFAILIHPLAIIACSIFACLRWFFRRFYDLIMIQMVRLLGRVPGKETNLAWKISGPGISRQFYQQISNADVIILIAAKLEKVILWEYEKRQLALINQPSSNIQSQLNGFFSIFEAKYTFSDKGVNLLTSRLSKKLTKRRNRIIKFTNLRIRFTKNELNFILRQSKIFIKKQMILKDMGQYIWEYFNIKIGDYNGLVEKILTQIFSKEILEPFEDLEMRFKLKENQVNSYSHKIERALEGQINLEMPTSFEIKNLKEKEAQQISKRFVDYKSVIQEIWGLQGLHQSWVSILRKNGYYINYVLEEDSKINNMTISQIRTTGKYKKNKFEI